MRADVLLSIAALTFIWTQIQADRIATETVWNGVYTTGQAVRGKTEYDASCASCHGSLVDGNRTELLKGKEFMQRWREDNLESLFSFLKASMPPASSKAKEQTPLSDQTYLEILIYMLQANEFPAGSRDLNIKELNSIQIEERDGPRPLATSTLVQVVGCLTRQEEIDGVVWTLTRASEPARTRESDAATADERSSAATRPLGTQSFRLQNLGYLGSGFNPNVYRGRKMHAKGVLVRQPGGQRLDVTFLNVLDSACNK